MKPASFPAGRLSRRRILTLFASAGGLALAPCGLAGATATRETLFEWRGRVLGTSTRIALAHGDRAVAVAAVARCLDEVARLERIFSLYVPHSELVRLNRDGRLDVASHDLRLLLAESLRLGAATNGTFDVTVQPLWRLYADHFTRQPDAAAGPDRRSLEAATARIDYRRIDVGAQGVGFLRSGMAATLNGIAQGYITDRVAGLLRDGGFDRVLLDLGETYGLGAAGTGRPWRVGVRDPADAARQIATVDLADRALASSAGGATRFDRAGRHHHLFDPRTGLSAGHYRGVTVIARCAATADALATGLSLAAPEDVAAVLRAGGGDAALLVLPDGTRRWVRA